MSSEKQLICEWCEGKGYYNLSATYDDVHSRIECTDCLGGGQSEVNDDCEQEWENENE